MINILLSVLKVTARLEVMRYVYIGVAATLVDWSVFAMFALLFGMNYELSLFFAYGFGSITNYILNKKITFRCGSPRIVAQLMTHSCVNIFGLLCNMVILFILVREFALHKLTARIITTLIMLLPNYLMHRTITFNKAVWEN